jgi:hypothetical protein
MRRALIILIALVGPMAECACGGESTLVPLPSDPALDALLQREQALLSQRPQDKQEALRLVSPHWLLAEDFERLAASTANGSLSSLALRKAASFYLKAGLWTATSGHPDSSLVIDAWRRFVRVARRFVAASPGGLDSSAVADVFVNDGLVFLVDAGILRSGRWTECAEPYSALFSQASSAGTRALAGAVLATLKRRSDWWQAVELAGQVHEIERNASVNSREEAARLSWAMDIVVGRLLGELDEWGQHLNVALARYYAVRGASPPSALLVCPALWDTLSAYFSDSLHDSGVPDSLDLVANRLATIPGIRVADVEASRAEPPEMIFRFVFWEGVEFRGTWGLYGLPWQTRAADRMARLGSEPERRRAGGQ